MLVGAAPTKALTQQMTPGARPTNGISIEFEIWSKFGVL